MNLVQVTGVDGKSMSRRLGKWVTGMKASQATGKSVSLIKVSAI